MYLMKKLLKNVIFNSHFRIKFMQTLAQQVWNFSTSNKKKKKNGLPKIKKKQLLYRNARIHI